MLRDGARGVIGVVQPQHLRAASDIARDGREVDEEAVLLSERQKVRLAPREHRADGVHGVARIGHERQVAGVDEAQRHVPDALLRPDQRQHLGRGVEAEPEAALVPPRDRLSQLRQPFRLRIAMVLGQIGRGVERIEDVRGRRQIRVADAEGDDVDALCPLLGDLAADLDEQIRRQLSDSFGQFHQRSVLHSANGGSAPKGGVTRSYTTSMRPGFVRSSYSMRQPSSSARARSASYTKPLR